MKRVTVAIDRVVLRGADFDQAAFAQELQSELGRQLARRSPGDGIGGARAIATLDVRGERNAPTQGPASLLARGIAGALAS